MSKAVKISLYSVLGVIGLFIIGILIMVATINPNNFKPTITQQVQTLTGRQLTINGDISWSLFPWLGMKVQDAQLDNPQGFGENPFATVKMADVSVKLFPLLLGKIELGNVVLEQPNIHLINKANGQNNWQDLVTPKAQQTHLAANTGHLANTGTSVITETSAQPSSVPNAKESLKVNISGINIHEGIVKYDDNQNNKHYAINNFNLTGKNIELNDAFPVSTSFDLKSNQPNLEGQVELESKIFINPDEQRYQLSNIKLGINAHIKQTHTTAKLDSVLNAETVDVDLKQQTLQTKGLDGVINGFGFEGDIQGTGIIRNPIYKGQLTATRSNIINLIQSFGVSMPTVGQPHAWDFTIPKAEFMITKNYVQVKPLNIVLGIKKGEMTNIQGDAKYQFGTLPLLNFNIKADKIDADYLLKSQPQAKLKNAGVINNAYALTPMNTSSSEPSLLDVLKIRGEINLDQFKGFNLKASNIRAVINGENNIINFNPITAKFYQGQYNGSIVVNLQSNTPQYMFNETLSGVQLQPLLNDVAQINNASGVLNLNSSLMTQGKNSKIMLSNLKGNANLSMNSGVINGIDILSQLEKVDAIVSHSQAPQAQAQRNKIAVGDLSATFNINDGIAQNDDLVLESPEMHIDGKGYINLVAQKWKYVLKVSLQGTGNQRLQRFEKLLGGSIPITVKGTFDKAYVIPDMHEISKALIGNHEKELGITADDSLKKNLGNKLQKRLQNILN